MAEITGPRSERALGASGRSVRIMIGGAVVFAAVAVATGVVVPSLRNGSPPETPPATLGPPIRESYLQERPVLAFYPRSDPRFRSVPVSCTNQQTLGACIAKLPATSQVVLQIPLGRFLLGPVIVDASNIVSASAVQDPGGNDWGVRVRSDTEGAKRLAAASLIATQESSPRDEIANIIDGHIISARVVQAKVASEALFIFSDLYQGKAEQLAARLNAGVIPPSSPAAVSPSP